jgi:arabinofuranosyltransferase
VNAADDALPWRPGLLETRRPIAALGGLTFLLVLIRTAWVCDDAYITFRTASNVLHGFGLRWNIANRVEVFTHPLWLFLITGVSAVTGEHYYTSIFVSIALSVAAVILVVSRLAVSAPAAVLAVSAFVLSRSFVEFSTSGLENPLTHLLLVSFFLVYFSSTLPDGRRRVFWVSCCAGLIMLNRLDDGLLVLPALAYEVWRLGKRRACGPLALGLLPLAAWELFSLVYYGFPFPNTAYAKLKTDIPTFEMVEQGLLYLLDAAGNDPLTLLAILGAVLSAWLYRTDRTIPLGIALYVAYVVWVGGDFMSGRFLAAPFLCAVVHLSRLSAQPPAAGWAVALGVVWLLGLTSPTPPLLSGATYGAGVPSDDSIPASHINNERRYYYPYTGLLTAVRGVTMPNHRWFHLGQQARDDARAGPQARVRLTDAAGFIGYAAGPEVRYVDRWGLGDPLLARLPAERPWQVGHYGRRPPVGYVETLVTGKNVIQDAGVAAYFEELRLITEGPVWSGERWRAIVGMNLGRYEHFVRFYGVARVQLSDVFAVPPDGADWNGPGAIVIIERAEVRLPARSRARGIELSVSRNDDYRVTVEHQGQRVHQLVLSGDQTDDSSLLTRHIDLPSELGPFDVITVQPLTGDRRYSLGHLRLVP